MPGVVILSGVGDSRLVRLYEGSFTMSFRFRHARILLAALLAVAATGSYAADLDYPRVDDSRPHSPPVTSGCTRASDVALIAVHVNELGRPFEVLTAKSSGCEALDRVGVDTVRNWHFLPATRNGEALAGWTAVGFQFDGTTVRQVDVPPETDISRAERDRIICKPQVSTTGSHIDPAPLCMAKWEWDERKRQQDEARRHIHVPTTIGTGGITGTPH